LLLGDSLGSSYNNSWHESNTSEFLCWDMLPWEHPYNCLHEKLHKQLDNHICIYKQYHKQLWNQKYYPFSRLIICHSISRNERDICQRMGNKPIEILQHVLIHLFSTVRNNAYRQWMKLLTSISDSYDKNRKLIIIALKCQMCNPCAEQQEFYCKWLEE
jgi:hypothetical protein